MSNPLQNKKRSPDKADLTDLAPTGGPKSDPKIPKMKKSALKDARQPKDSEAGGGDENFPMVPHSHKLIDPRKKCDKGEYYEKELAEQMGIAREYIRQFRERCLTEGKDWVLVGRSVLLRNTAVDWLLRELQVDANDIPKKDPPFLLKVAKIWPNAQLLGCVSPQGEPGDIKNIRVRKNTLFRIGQLVPVRNKSDGSLVLAVRHPRTRGKLK